MNPTRITKPLTLILAASLLALPSAFAQVGKLKVQPDVARAVEAKLIPLDAIDHYFIPPIDLAAVQAEDAKREQDGLAPRFAIPSEVLLTPANSGTWEALELGERIWRLRISAPGAYSLNLGFEQYQMPPDGRLSLYSADQRYRVRPFTAADNDAHGQLWTPVLLTDDMVIEVVLPAAEVGALRLELTRINQGYRGFGEPTGGISSGDCNVDVVCPEGDDWWNEIPGIAVISTGGYLFCTGFMVNNTAYDRKPYFMTANHCGISLGNAASLVCYWNFETSVCDGNPDGQLNEFNSGSIFRSSYSASDFTLVELDDDPDPDFGVSFVGWDRSGAEAQPAIAIHHPNCDEKRISFEYQATTTTSYLSESIPGDGTHVRIEDWDLGTTEPGSSGSPLFDQDHRVIGQLHGGYASCTSQTSDWYGRFSVSWNGGGSPSTRLRDWLDAGNTGMVTVDTISGRGITVEPGGDVLHVGVVGGPFTEPATIYTLRNQTGQSLDFVVRLDPAGDAPLFLNGATDPISGTIPAGGPNVTVDVTLDPAVNALGQGTYTTDVIFEDLTNGLIQLRSHVVEVGLTAIEVSPDEGLVAGGPIGGPFDATVTYTITSTRPTPVDVTVAASANWISLDGGTQPLVFTLNGIGAARDVVVGYSDNAERLGPGFYEGTVDFTNAAGGAGSTQRPVSLDVGRYIYPATDVPQPIQDYSTITSRITVPDSYEIADVDVEMDITHTYIGDLIVSLRSPGGTTVRLHNRTGADSDDIRVTYDDDSYPPDGPGRLADFNGQNAVGTWTLTVSDNAGLDIGTLNAWTLRIARSNPYPAGDLNCDGGLDGADIDPFFLAVADPATYEQLYPNCDRMLADVNGDNAVDGADIEPFFLCLDLGQCP